MYFYISQALKGLNRNPMRSFLTTLGIMIGIATVIIVLSVGAGFKSYVNAQIDLFGSNTVIIQTQLPPTSKDRASGSSNSGEQSAFLTPVTTLKKRDIEEIKRLPNVVNAYGASIGQQPVSFANVNKNAFIFGSDASRFDIDKGVIEKGRPFSEIEDSGLSQVAVLGYDIARDIFGDNDPIGKVIRIGNYNFEVVGVYARKGSFGFSNDDAQVFIPIQTLQKKILGTDYLFYAVVSLEDNNIASSTALDMEDILRRNHQISDPIKDDFKVQTQSQSMETFDAILKAITFLLIAIAAISLVVGGVGVMNIMYVVVTERISEIGLKKAIGAKNNDILYEFLVEAIMLTFVGGVFGIVIGAFLSFLIAKIANALGLAWAFSVPIAGVFLGVGVSGAIGLIFGVFPARNAAKKDPIEALRYE